MIRFPDVAKVKAGRKTVFKYKNGIKETFYGLQGGRKFRAVLESLHITSSATSSRGGRHHLCPKCTASLVADRYACPKCRFEFKNPVTARWVSILLPGGGYFYTRHHILGVLDALVELPLMILIVLMAFGRQLGFGTFAGDDPMNAVIIAIVFLFEKLITIYHADHFIKEYIPVEREFNRLPKPPPPAKVRGDMHYKDLEDERVTFK